MKERIVTRSKIEFKGSYNLAYLHDEDTPFTGKVVDFHDEGQKKCEDNYKDGKEHGLETRWHINGQKKLETNWKDGKEHGLETRWHINGQKQVETNWKEGKKDGTEIWFP